MSPDPQPTGEEAALTSELLEVARDAAAAAAAVLLKYFARGVSATETKSTGTDMVSEADVNAEAAIRKVLAERRPDDVVLGEEGGLTRADGTPVAFDGAGTEPSADGDLYGGDAVLAARAAAQHGLVWICDPLDGTTNFLYGLKAWCVSVAVRDAKGAVAGVVIDPLAGETFVAARGGLALLVDRHNAVTPLDDASQRDVELGKALIGTGFAYSAEVRRHQAKVIAGLIDQVRDVRRTGAAALDLCWAAAGRLDAYYERTVRPWDIAAGALLCEQVGLDVRYLPTTDAAPYGLMAAPPALVEPIWALVADGAEPVPGAALDLLA
ncbi:MAG: hypothetical protein J7513_08395 [Solirubrobacteraceae bacterium]|nr:hypothetical protein [Solirubrobacteraceae bacterium]